MTCTKLPATATAGLDFQAVLTLPDYPGPAWSVSAVLRGPGQINLTADSTTQDHTLTASATDTAAWVPGRYWYSVRVTDGVRTLEATQGQIDILPDLAGVSAPYDGRSQNEIALEAINAVLAKRATRDQQRYTINNRELWRTPMGELLQLRAFYTVQVRRERARASGCTGFGRPIQVKFSNQ